ncbi:TetR family transcriptional regulator [Leifsonia sp. ALI-44-B]|uniref:TetR/AcrR family transcriptional regulator n=1 Tax=Leifsonia sp. ALI-44-B TaxID=1933776 RepID=UPI00097BC81D|nr:TetR/AcrR family transcriptional regulator [Leifsonia sp. ALI-44-B]ONI60729.1 TetR family transcriptional regulator [Leifsonia sp. ALI-44-B]
MSRWQPDARGRLERAALELFARQGFAETTVPEITAEAGLTTRTFFRHFADKREVLFAAEAGLPPFIAQLMAEAPAELGPYDTLTHSLETVAATRFDGLLDYLIARRAVIRSDAGLRERELRKQEVLAEAIEQGFLARGVDEATSSLVGRMAAVVFNVSLDRWLDLGGSRTLLDLMREHLAITRATFGEASER